jgi:hypothetical protein
MDMVRTFRKYHRAIALIVSLPLLLSIVTGIGYTLFDEWFAQEQIGEFLLDLHTLKPLGLGNIYPLLNGLGLLGLLVTGLSMSGLFRSRNKAKS